MHPWTLESPGGAALWESREKVETLLPGPANTQGEARPALLRVPHPHLASSPKTQILILSPPTCPPALLALTLPSWRLTSSEVEDPIVAVSSRPAGHLLGPARQPSVEKQTGHRTEPGTGEAGDKGGRERGGSELRPAPSSTLLGFFSLHSSQESSSLSLPGLLLRKVWGARH